jgi:hypothetical protein
MFSIKFGIAIAAIALANPNNLFTFAQTVCGITDDASWVSMSIRCFLDVHSHWLRSVADCQHILDNFPTPNFGNKCHYTVNGISHDAFNTACFGGCKCASQNCPHDGITADPLQVAYIRTRMASAQT